MFSNVYGVGLRGIDGCLVQAETDIQDGLPSFVMVGALAPEVREAQDRVRTSLKNAGFRWRPGTVTINLSPAGLRKTGTGFDLPIAAGILLAEGLPAPDWLEEAVWVGELGLSGEVKPVRGILSMVLEARHQGKAFCILPEGNVREGLVIPGIRILGIRHVRQLAELLRCGREELLLRGQEGGCQEEAQPEAYAVDYEEVQGQYLMKRAAEVAAAGGHNLLYIGAAGTGKTMTAERIPTILPSCTLQERLEISRIYSICGLLPPDRPLMHARPFRSPHHGATVQALTGGGRSPVPGEMSLASGGVLFLDEFPEFSRHVIDALRQPLESRKVVLSRVSGRYEFPADFLFVAAMNPCPCGYYPDRRRCSCSESQIRSYLGRLPRPILDRIDICVSSSPVAFDELRGKGKTEPSAAIRRRVEQARERQRIRFAGTPLRLNSQIYGEYLERFCRLDAEEEQFFRRVYEEREMSARAYARVLRVARTIADLDGEEQIHHRHLCEAIGYRRQEEWNWKKTE